MSFNTYVPVGNQPRLRNPPDLEKDGGRWRKNKSKTDRQLIMCDLKDVHVFCMMRCLTLKGKGTVTYRFCFATSSRVG